MHPLDELSYQPSQVAALNRPSRRGGQAAIFIILAVAIVIGYMVAANYYGWWPSEHGQIASPTPTLSESPSPEPTPTGASCTPQGTCRNDESCPDGTACSGLPAYGCYPVGCPTPICLSANTKIAVPGGETLITELKEDMLVWTQDKSGKRTAAPVRKVSSMPASPEHVVIRLKLQDGREVQVSPGHPTADGRTVDELKAGDSLDGSTVASVEQIPYKNSATYDLMPGGTTGVYWANGILLKSTLRDGN